jgi:hypothetical protein
MLKRALRIIALFVFLSCLPGTSQTVPTVSNQCPYAHHALELACIIPDLTKTGTSSNLSGFNTTLAQVLSQLPQAVPVSGFALSFDRSLGIYTVSSENLGSVLTERGDTIGRHKVFIGFTFQRFVFQAIDGTSLSDLPTISQNTSSGIFTYSKNSLGANVNQYTAVAAFGLTDRVDISVTLPFERVSLSAANNNLQEAIGSGIPATLPPVSVAGSASGPGDLLLNVKGTVWKGERLRAALGSEFRFPTGNEFNLLGSGAYGIKPYFVVSRRGRIEPHANLGYQWNGFSYLYVNPCITIEIGQPRSCQTTSTSNPNYGIPTLRLPSNLDYSAGVDIGVVKRLTVVADLVGQLFFNAPRITPPTPSTLPNLPTHFQGLETVGIKNGNFNDDNLGVGVKVNPIGKLLVSANVLIRLNTGGLRADYIPLVGVSYKF